MRFELRLILIVAAIAVAAGGVIWFGGQGLVLELFDWLKEMGLWAVALFILIDMVFVILVLPGVMLTMGAGFLFGVLQGTAYVVAASATGAAIAFLIARRLLGERWVVYLRTHRKLSRMERGLSHEGWKLVLITRLIPFFPFKLSNYFFGVTRISFSQFFLGNLIGIVPLTLTNVYLGSIAADLATLGAGRETRSWVDWAIYGAGFVVALAALIYLARLGRRILSAGAAQGETQTEDRRTDRSRPAAER